MIAYTYISMPLLVHDANQVFHSVGLSWPSIRDGYRARAKKFGLRNRDWNAFFYFAALAGDAAVANEAFENIGEKWDSALWHDRNNFDSAVRWMQSAKSPAK
jgi:hypothetical protein